MSISLLQQSMATVPAGSYEVAQRSYNDKDETCTITLEKLGSGGEPTGQFTSVSPSYAVYNGMTLAQTEVQLVTDYGT